MYIYVYLYLYVYIYIYIYNIGARERRAASTLAPAFARREPLPALVLAKILTVVVQPLHVMYAVLYSFYK